MGRPERILIGCLAMLAGVAASAQQAELGPAPVAPDWSSTAGGRTREAAAAEAAGSWLDTSSRETVRYYYNAILAATRTASMGWTGSVAGCAAGTTAQGYRDAVAMRVNWVRAMAGVPAGVTLDAAFNGKDQQMALMISANKQLSHSPPSGWACYTAAGAEAAGKSNICYWYGSFDDPGCVELYMSDPGSGNSAAGHRRWILYPSTEVMGSGDVSETGSWPSSNPMGNALWVIPSSWPARPATRDEFVAWPPKGYVPYQVVAARWSFSYPAADFSGASVAMTRAGGAVPVRLETVQNGYGENTLVWVADNLTPDTEGMWPRPTADTPITVVVSNVLIGGQPRSFSYQVTIFDPDTPPLEPAAVFRDTAGQIRLNRYGTAALYPAGGVFADDPAAAQDFSGRTVVAARDQYGALYASTFTRSTLAWSGWAYGGGVVRGKPAIAAATGGTAVIAARDAGNSYWLASYTPGGPLGNWVWLGGVFPSDPEMAAAPDGSVYLVGKDAWSALWCGRYVPGAGFQGWQYGGGVVKGKPSISAGTDGVAYIAARDDYDALWMARFQNNTWLGWSFGGGVMKTDPRVAASDTGVVYAAVLDSHGGLWYRGYSERSSGGWLDWTFAGGVLEDMSAAALNGVFYAAGRDQWKGLWWYRASTNQWLFQGPIQDSVGGLAAAPK